VYPAYGKTIRVSDISGVEIAEGKGTTVRITFKDARKGVRELDVTDAEAEKTSVAAQSPAVAASRAAHEYVSNS
jgi:hypothetical protein